MEWPHVIVLGASAQLFPHQLSEDVEEERRVFHVALTRGKTNVLVFADAGAPSPFLDELADLAPSIPAEKPGEAATAVQPERRAAPEPPPQVDAGATRVPARLGLRLVARGGYPGRIVALGAQVATIDALGAPRLAVRYGTEVVIDGKARVLTAPVVEDEAPVDPALIEILRSWRAQRAREDGVPDDVVMNNEQLDGIALRKPQSLGDLAGCPGMGPTRLTRYGDEILLAIEEAASR